jgi:LytS/YehU family sensor histidine kinase
VELDKELMYLKNFVELEKIRLEKDMQVEFSQHGDFTKHFIAPLMLIVFVENSFKHLSYPRNGQGFILIDLAIDRDMLVLNVKNSIDPSQPVTKNKNEKGIGIENVQKRLNMLYPHKHELEMKHFPNLYSVYLKIVLN